MYYFRYIFIIHNIIYSIYRDIDLWIGRISIFIFDLEMNLFGINISIVCTNVRIRGAHRYITLHCSLSNDQIE